MASQTLPISNNGAYVETIRGLLRLHELTENGQDDSPEADAIRDALELPWHELSDIEKTRITGLSEDLYSISDPFPERMPTNPAAEQGRLDAIAASQAGDPDRALVLLRRSAQHLDRASLSFERGCVWVEAGDSETAKPFLAHAAKLDPSHGSVLYLYLSALNKSEPTTAASKSREIVSEPEQYPALGVVKAAEILWDSSLRMPENETRPLLRQLIGALVVALNKVQASVVKEDSLFVPTHSSIRKSLGYCYFCTGDNPAAIEHFNAGLSLDPDNDALLIARGTVLYALDSHAIADFEQALSRDSKAVWPYFYLAHYYLVGNNFDECRRMCERARARRAERGQGSPQRMVGDF